MTSALIPTAQRVVPLQCIGAFILLCLPALAPAQQMQQLRGHVPDVAAKLTPVGQLPDTTTIDLIIGLPLRNAESLTTLEHDIYQPGSPRYLQYLTPEQYTQRFCPSHASFAALLGFARTHGLKVIAAARNRKFVHVRAPARVVNRVFHVTLKLYRHPTEDRLFYAPDVEPTIELRTPILHITGLDNLHVPGRFPRRSQPQPGSGDPRYAGGSGTGGAYTGMDFRAAYAPGVSLTGKGQVVGILELLGYTTSDITTYEANAGITPVPLQNVYLDGYVGGGPNLESAADIELVISMAPGLSKAVIYGAPNNNPGVHDVLNEMANPMKGEPLPHQISSSYYFFYDQNVYDALKQLALQGQALFVASGDYGSYDEVTGAGAFPPADHPRVTSVGGTELQTSGPRGTWVSETAIFFSGGGYSPWAAGDPQFVIPYWQSGMDFTASQGSTTARNAPDVAMVANNISVYFNGAWQWFAGTSASAPLWAGFWALVNEQAAANGRPQIGFANPPLYWIGRGPDYASAFHDITSGNNFNATNPTKYSAVVGFDLVTGWGTPNGAGLIDALTRPRFGPCDVHPEDCYGVFDPLWWLKCPACTINIFIHQGDDIRQVTVFESTGREVGTFGRLSAPVVQGGVTYDYRITLRPKKGIGYVLSAEAAPGREIQGRFRPAYMVRRSGVTRR
jgi:subtilase family serine protease